MGFGIGDWGFGKAEGRSGNRIRSGRHPIPNPESPIPASWPPPVEAHERRRVRQLVQALTSSVPASADSRNCANSLGMQPAPITLWPWPRSTSERSEEHTSELQSLMRISYAVFCLKNKNKNKKI